MWRCFTKCCQQNGGFSGECAKAGFKSIMWKFICEKFSSSLQFVRFICFLFIILQITVLGLVMLLMLSFTCQSPAITMTTDPQAACNCYRRLFRMRIPFPIRLANVNSHVRVRCMLSPVRLSVCLSVGNARAPYSGGCNFPQYFYGIRYDGNP